MNYYIVMDNTLYGQGQTPESALEDAMNYGDFDDMTVDDLIDNTEGRRHQVTNLDVVLTDRLRNTKLTSKYESEVYVP